MPAIFSKEIKSELYHRMIEVGWQLLVGEGIAAVRVERVARSVGIAKGTFYSFFSSKGDFVYAMLMENRQRGVDELERARARAGRALTRAELGQWLVRVWGGERNIFRIFTYDEYVRLVRSFPEGRSLAPAGDGALVRWIATEIVALEHPVDVREVENLNRVLALTLLNRRRLHPEVLERTVAALQEDVLDALFGEA